MKNLQDKWDCIYQAQKKPSGVASEVLVGQQFLLPRRGNALDLACGLGSNALLMAERGLTVEAWDISPVALGLLQEEADLRGLAIDVRCGPVTEAELAIRQFDVIVVSRFLDRSLCNAIMGALNPHALLFYQTFTRDKLDAQGPNNPDYLLEPNELLTLFAPLKLLYYQEFAAIGDLGYGNRNEACFIGQQTKPSTTS